MATYGYKAPSVAAGFEDTDSINSLNELVTVGGKMAEHGWAYQWRIRGGRRGADTPTLVGELRSVDAATNPDALLERTDPFNAGTAMNDATDGIEYVRPLRGAAKMRNGKRYGLGVVACDGLLGYGLLPASAVPSGNNTRIYRRSLAVPTPQDPMGYTQSSAGFGWLAISVDYEPNVPPDVPGDLLPVDNATGLGVTPVFSGNFRDDNEALPNGLAGDELAKVQLIVWADATDALMWDVTVNATSAQKAARAWSIPYDGAALDPGDIVYRWQSRVQDQFGVWSEFSDPRSFVCGGPIFTATGPTGKIDTLLPTFTGTYDHASGEDCGSIGIVLLDGDTLAQVGSSMSTPMFPGTITPGDPLSEPAGNFIDMPQLEWGGRYRFQFHGDDQAGVHAESPPSPLFWVNTPPSVPVIVGPENGEVASDRPEVIVIASDIDDTVATGLAVTLEVLDDAGAVLQTRSMTFDPLLMDWPYPIWRYQLTSGDLPSTDTYRLRAYSYDGTVYSGGRLSSSNAIRSDDVVLVYASGPVVTHTSPANLATVETNTPVYDWDATDQQRFRVQVFTTFEDGSDLLVYDSGERVQTATYHTQPAGYIEDGAGYYRKITVWNSLNQMGISTAAFFTAEYSSPAAPSDFTATPVLAAGDPFDQPSAILLSWTPPPFSDSQYQYARLTRRVEGETPVDIDDPVGLTNVAIANVHGVDNATFIDYLPASGVTYIYGVKYLVIIDGVRIMSETAHAEATVTFDATIVCDARRGGDRRVVLPYRRDRETEYERDQSFETAWGSSKPTAIRSTAWTRVVGGEFQIVGENPADVEAVIRSIEALDAGGGPHCWRDGRSRRYFGELTAVKAIDPPGGRVRRVQLGFRQTNAAEVFV